MLVTRTVIRVCCSSWGCSWTSFNSSCRKV